MRFDLRAEPPQPFAELAAAHQIVHAARSKRDVNPTGGKTVGSPNDPKTLYRLAMGHDHRGATWFEEAVNVLWLCAYGFHRSGDANDAYPYFHALMRSGEIWPVREDYVWLERDRAARLAEQLPEAAQALLEEARNDPNHEHRAVIGGGQVGIVVQVVETLEETYVAISVSTLGDPTRLVALLAAFYPDHPFGDWQHRNRLPNRALRAGEICRSILHG